MPVGGIRRGAVCLAFLVGAEHGDGEVGQRGAPAFARVEIESPAVDRALDHAAADRGQAQLHDDIRRSAEQCARAGHVSAAWFRIGLRCVRLRRRWARHLDPLNE